MANHDPRAVANEFIGLSNEPIDQMKLHKLVYIAHGWNLAINGEPLVFGTIEAWDEGPVMRSIWNHLRDFGYSTINGFLCERHGEPFQATFPFQERTIINRVWLKYGGLSSLQLSEMTHRPGTPWSNTYFGSGNKQFISNYNSKAYFRKLALAGR